VEAFYDQSGRYRPTCPVAVANALFWRPQVALLVNSRKLLPVFMELAPAATLLERAPAAIEAVLRRPDVRFEWAV
jgi:hypothetical protein